MSAISWPVAFSSCCWRAPCVHFGHISLVACDGDSWAAVIHMHEFSSTSECMGYVVPVRAIDPAICNQHLVPVGV